MKASIIKDGIEFTILQTDLSINSIQAIPKESIDCYVGHIKPFSGDKGCVSWMCSRCNYVRQEIYDTTVPSFIKHSECEYCGKRFDIIVGIEE